MLKKNFTEDKGFNARIKEVSSRGLMTIKFSDTIIIPSNFTLIDDSILSIKVKPHINTANNDDKTINFWKVTQMNQNEMIIKLQFKEKKSISILPVNNKIY